MNRTHVKLASVVDLNASAPPVFTGTKEYVSTGALDCDHIDPSQIELVSFEDRPSRANLYPALGDILFAKMAATVKTILVDSETAGKIYSTGFFALHPKDSLISGRLLYHFLFSDSFHRQKDKLSTGATMKGLTNGGFSQISMLLPERAEQDNLADRLDTIRALIRNRDKQLAALDTLAKSLFVEMFGDPLENPKRWRNEPLSNVLEEGASVTYGIVKTGDFIEEGVPVFRPVDIVAGRIPRREDLKRTSKLISDQYRRTLLKGNELLITVRGSIGDTFQVTTEFRGCNVGRNIVPLRLDNAKIKNRFLQLFFSMPSVRHSFEQMTKGIALQGINMCEFREMLIPTPPITLQNDFVSSVEHIDKSKFAVRKSLDELNRLYRSLLQQYFG